MKANMAGKGDRFVRLSLFIAATIFLASCNNDNENKSKRSNVNYEEDDSIDDGDESSDANLYNGLKLVDPRLKYSFVTINDLNSNQFCSGIFVTRKKILTAAHCLIDGILNSSPKWSHKTNSYIRINTRDLIIKDVYGKVIYDGGKQSVSPKIFLNPNVDRLTRIENKDFYDHEEGSATFNMRVSSNTLSYKSLRPFDLGIIDFGDTDIGLAKDPQVDVVTEDHIAADIVNTKVSARLSRSTGKHLVVAGAGQYVLTTGTSTLVGSIQPGGTSRFQRLPKPLDPFSIPGSQQDKEMILLARLGLAPDNYAYFYSQSQQRLQGWPCPGDSGGPFLYLPRNSGRSRPKVQVLGVVSGSHGLLDCQNWSKSITNDWFAFTKTSSPEAGKWLDCMVKNTDSNICKDHSHPLDLALANYRGSLSGNVVYLFPGQSIDSTDGKVRLLMQHDGNLVAYCKKTKSPLWAASSNTDNYAVMAMGFRGQPEERTVSIVTPPKDQWFQEEPWSRQTIKNVVEWLSTAPEDAFVKKLATFPLSTEDKSKYGDSQSNAISKITVYSDGIEFSLVSLPDPMSQNEDEKVIGKFQWDPASCM